MTIMREPESNNDKEPKVGEIYKDDVWTNRDVKYEVVRITKKCVFCISSEDGIADEKEMRFNKDSSNNTRDLTGALTLKT